MVSFLADQTDASPQHVVQAFWNQFDFDGRTAGPQEFIGYTKPYDDQKDALVSIPFLQDLLPSRGTVLDVGAGKALLGDAIVRYSDAQGLGIQEVISTDKYDWHLPSQIQGGRHVYVLQKGDDLEVGPKTVDLAILKWVLHHIPEADQKRIIRNLYAIVKPGRRVVVIEAVMGQESELAPQFLHALENQEIWPKGPWADSDRQLTIEYLRLNKNQQQQVLALEDFYGHVLVSHRLWLPQPLAYMDRETIVRRFAEAGFVEIKELFLPYGFSPIVRLGPPSVRYVFEKPAAAPTPVAAGLEEEFLDDREKAMLKSFLNVPSTRDLPSLENLVEDLDKIVRDGHTASGKSLEPPEWRETSALLKDLKRELEQRKALGRPSSSRQLPPRISRGDRRLMAWVLGMFVVGAAAVFLAKQLAESFRNSQSIVRSIDSAPVTVSKTAIGDIHVSMVPGALRVKLPPGFSGKPVRGFFLIPPQPQPRIERGFWHGPAPTELVVPENGVLHFETPRGLERMPGYDWPSAARRLFVVFDTHEAAREMTGQVVLKDVPPEPPEKFRGILLFLRIESNGIVTVLHPNPAPQKPNSGLEERVEAGARVRQLFQSALNSPANTVIGIGPEQFQDEAISAALKTIGQILGSDGSMHRKLQKRLFLLTPDPTSALELQGQGFLAADQKNPQTIVTELVSRWGRKAPVAIHYYGAGPELEELSQALMEWEVGGSYSLDRHETSNDLRAFLRQLLANLQGIPVEAVRPEVVDQFVGDIELLQRA